MSPQDYKVEPKNPQIVQEIIMQNENAQIDSNNKGRTSMIDKWFE